MSLLPDTASFHERVQALFVAYRARGVALSAVDLDLVDAWAEQAVPFEVVARGMRKAAETALFDARADDKGLRSLKACKRSVETEINRYLKASAGQTTSAVATDVEPFHLTRAKALARALKHVAGEHPHLERAVARLLVLSVPVDFAQSQAREELAMATLCRALPFEERTRLLREARVLVQNGGAVTPATRRESLRFHRAALVRQHLEMKPFW